MIRRFDWFGGAISPVNVDGPIGPQMNSIIKAIWIDPSSETDLVQVLAPGLPSLVQDGGTSGVPTLSGIVAAVGGTPFDPAHYLGAALGYGSGVVISPSAPLIQDISSGPVVLIAVRSSGSLAGSQPMRERASVCVAYDELPGSIPAKHSPVMAEQVGGTAPVFVRVPFGGRTRAILWAQELSGTQVGNIRLVLYKERGGSFVSVTSAVIVLPAGSQNIWDYKDFFPNNVMGDWLEIQGNGSSTNLTVGVEVFD